jgi:glyceraldehyde-3-phosphate dehydrogenase/erythrose-4-phosphate dehydrogenase
MTKVVVAGNTVRTRHFIRYALGRQTVEVVGIVDDGPAADLSYGLLTDSGPSQFRGTVEVLDGALVLAGRHGRGGLRHDHIPLYDDVDKAMESAGHVDALVLSEDRADEIRESEGRTVVSLGRSVPNAVSDAVSRIAASLDSSMPVCKVLVSTTGAANPTATSRDRLVELRGARGGLAVRAAGWAAPSFEVIGGPNDRVSVSSVFLVLKEHATEDAVRRRLHSAGRRALAECQRQDAGPVTSSDVVGSAAAVLDLSAVQVIGDVVALPLFVDSLAVEARLACDLVSEAYRPPAGPDLGAGS